MNTPINITLDVLSDALAATTTMMVTIATTSRDLANDRGQEVNNDVAAHRKATCQVYRGTDTMSKHHILLVRTKMFRNTRSGMTPPLNIEVVVAVVVVAVAVTTALVVMTTTLVVVTGMTTSIGNVGKQVASPARRSHLLLTESMCAPITRIRSICVRTRVMFIIGKFDRLNAGRDMGSVETPEQRE
jgi:hypothetical protein